MESSKKNELKKTVWVIEVRDHDEKMGSGGLTGVCIGKNRILTCCHGISHNDSIYGRMSHETVWRPLETVYVRPSWDVRLLKVKKGFVNADFDYAPISENEKLVVDEVVYHIGHPLGLSYSFLPGKVAYPCVQVPRSDFLDCSDSLICVEHVHNFSVSLDYKTLGCMCNKSTLRDSRDLLLLDLQKHQHPMTPVILLLGMGVAAGSSGGPIFRANGEVVGILSRTMQGYGISIHVSVLKALIDEADSNEKKADAKRFFQSTSLVNFDTMIHTYHSVLATPLLLIWCKDASRFVETEPPQPV